MPRLTSDERAVAIEVLHELLDAGTDRDEAVAEIAALVNVQPSTIRRWPTPPGASAEQNVHDAAVRAGARFAHADAAAQRRPRPTSRLAEHLWLQPGVVIAVRPEGRHEWGRMLIVNVGASGLVAVPIIDAGETEPPAGSIGVGAAFARAGLGHGTWHVVPDTLATIPAGTDTLILGALTVAQAREVAAAVIEATGSRTTVAAVEMETAAAQAQRLARQMPPIGIDGLKELPK